MICTDRAILGVLSWGFRASIRSSQPTGSLGRRDHEPPSISQSPSRPHQPPILMAASHKSRCNRPISDRTARLRSLLDALGERQCILNLNNAIPNRAVDFRVTAAIDTALATGVLTRREDLLLL